MKVGYFMEKSSDKKTLILNEAAILFSKRGYFGVGLNEILSTCNIPKGSFYHYFPKGKNQLAVEVIHYAYHSMENGILTNLFSKSNNAAEVFMLMCNMLAKNVLEEDHLFQSLIITFMGIEATFISEELSKVSKDVYHQWENLYRNKLIECGYSSNQADIYAPLLCSLIHGSLISCWIKKDNHDLINLINVLPTLLPEIQE